MTVKETKPKQMNRRRFLLTAASVVGGAVVLCGGGAAVLSWQPGAQIPEFTPCGEETTMTSKTLIVYATRGGSTAEIAQYIGRSLCEAGGAVDVKAIKDVKDLSGYAAVVIGSGIRMGQWLPEALEFARAHQAELAEKATAYFAVHLNNQGDDETSRAGREAYLAPAREIAVARTEGYFVGVYNPKTVSLLDRLILSAMKTPVGDFRDWKAIDAWTEDLRQRGFVGAAA